MVNDRYVVPARRHLSPPTSPSKDSVSRQRWDFLDSHISPFNKNTSQSSFSTGRRSTANGQYVPPALRPPGPLRDYQARQVTGDQVRQVLEGNTNPFTNNKWSRKYNANRFLELRKKLPVFDYMNSFFRAFKNHQVVIVHGDTGTGKTTQVPQFVAYADLPHHTGKKIGCAQTRRIAATAAARRVADEMDLSIGREVGYSVRFDANHDPASTFLVFMTDGMLLHEATHDKWLSKYSTIILDEVHERTLATDVLMGFLKTALSRRPDLKLVIMSATMDAEQLGEYFGASNPFLLEVPGRTHPVELVYSPEPVIDYRVAAVQQVVDIHRNEPEGDVLVFLTGEDEIEEACERVREEVEERLDPRVFGPLVCLPLYSNLPQHLQQKVWEDPVYEPKPRRGDPPGRKVIIATNIAETSLTIEGIVYIVDPGFRKPKVFDQDSESGLEWLTVQAISKASAHQRKGRAGRTRPGKCFRLYTEQEYEGMPDREMPEMQTISLGELVLMLAANGFRDPKKFPYIDRPDDKALARAQGLLKHLGAVDEHNALTLLGRKMVQFPLDVQLSKMLITSPEFECSDEIVTITAILSAPPLWFRPRDKKEKTKADDIKRHEFDDRQSDHLTLLNAYNAYVSETSHLNDTDREEWCKEKFVSFKALREAHNIRAQLVRIMERNRIPLISCYVPMSATGMYARLSADDAGEQERLRENIRKALVSGFFLQVAHSRALSDLALTSKGKKRGTLNWERHGGSKSNKGNMKMRNSFRTVRDDVNAVLHPSSALPLTEESEWVIFHDFVFTSMPFIRTVTAIEEDWLEKYSFAIYNPEIYKDRETRMAINYIKTEIAHGKEEGKRKEEEEEEEKRQKKEAKEKRKEERKEEKRKKKLEGEAEKRKEEQEAKVIKSKKNQEGNHCKTQKAPKMETEIRIDWEESESEIELEDAESEIEWAPKLGLKETKREKKERKKKEEKKTKKQLRSAYSWI